MNPNPRIGMLAFWSVLLALEVLVMNPSRLTADRPTVSIVTDDQPGPPVRHGLGKLSAALRGSGIDVQQTASPGDAKGGILVAAGLGAGKGPAGELLKELRLDAPTGREALRVARTTWKGKPALLVCGSDARGLMYALLDIARRVGWAGDANDPFSEVKDVAESPAVAERALSKYTMHRGNFESCFHDPNYWERFLDTLAENRFNTFALIFGYENWGYFAPPYPYFFDVEGFDGIRVVGITPEQQKRNLDSLNRVIRMTHDRGLSFTLGIWDHIYRGGVQGPTEHARQPTAGLVWGVTPQNLTAYTKAGLARFLKEVPNIDAVQFRMHDESGLTRKEMDEFWPTIFKVMKESAPAARFDARAKGLPDSLIDNALDMGLNIRICTKYWAEQMGMPFHPSHINRQNQFDRRHGYADLLRYPQRYKMHWRLWNGGTSRVLLWGDPEYVRRFAESTHLYDGEGFEVNEPLATKMQDHPHDEKPFDLLDPRYRYYDWEFERYWHFFQVFGRVGYNPKTPPEVWDREFQRRFGPQAGPLLEQALHRASWITPRITTCIFPYGSFPMTRGWAERQRRGDLGDYAKADVGDTEQFSTIQEAAKLIVQGGESARTSPRQTADWFARAGSDVLDLVAQAQKQAGANAGKEFASTVVDLKIMANLALFHSRRIPAGLAWALFDQTQDLNALDEAIRHEANAIEAWEALVSAAEDVYCDNLKFGRPSAGLSGHWKDELAALRKGLRALEEKRKAFAPAGTELRIAHVPQRRAVPGADLVVQATVTGPKAISGVRVRYRTGQEGFHQKELASTGPMLYRGVIPAGDVAKGLAYFIEAADEGGGTVSFPADGKSAPIAVTVTLDRDPPTVTHEPIVSAPASKPLRVTAEVKDPSGVKWVRLRYRGVNQHFDYQTLDMKPIGKADQYEAEIPADQVKPEWDLMYFIEAMDACGNGRIHPDLERQTPYVVIRLGGR